MGVQFAEHHVCFQSQRSNYRIRQPGLCQASAQIYLSGSFLSHCLIKDVTKSGMSILFPLGSRLPDSFEVRTELLDRPVQVSRNQ
jgi:hypothetical protein